MKMMFQSQRPSLFNESQFSGTQQTDVHSDVKGEKPEKKTSNCCVRFNNWLESNFDDENLHNDDSSLGYSSGQSDESDMIELSFRQYGLPFSELTKMQRDEQCFMLWQKVIKKLRASIYSIQAFAILHRRLFLAGTTKKYQAALGQNSQDKACCCIIMPNTRLRKIWSAIVQILLLYTALYVPFKIAYLAHLEKGTPFMDRVDGLVDILFVCDLFLNFIIAYETKHG
jgi:hypothetical protein